MRAFRFAAVLWSIIALGVSAYLFFVSATQFDPVDGDLFSLGTLFRGFAIANAVAAVLVLVHPRGWAGVVATIVALLGAALVIAPAVTALALPLGLPRVPHNVIWTLERITLAAAQVFAVLGGVMIASRRR